VEGIEKESGDSLAASCRFHVEAFDFACERRDFERAQGDAANNVIEASRKIAAQRTRDCAASGEPDSGAIAEVVFECPAIFTDDDRDRVVILGDDGPSVVQIR